MLGFINILVLSTMPTIDLIDLNIFNPGLTVYKVEQGYFITSWQGYLAALVDSSGKKIATYSNKSPGPDGLEAPIFLYEEENRFILLNKRRHFVELIMQDQQFILNPLDVPPLPQNLGNGISKGTRLGDNHYCFVTMDNHYSDYLSLTLKLEAGEWQIKQLLKPVGKHKEAMDRINGIYFATRYLVRQDQDGYVVLLFDEVPDSLLETPAKLKLSATIADAEVPFQIDFKAIVAKVSKIETGLRESG